MSHPWPWGLMRPRVAVDTAQHKAANLLKTFFSSHQCLLAFVYVMGGPRQLFSFQGGPAWGRSRRWPQVRTPQSDSRRVILKRDVEEAEGGNILESPVPVKSLPSRTVPSARTCRRAQCFMASFPTQPCFLQKLTFLDGTRDEI